MYFLGDHTLYLHLWPHQYVSVLRCFSTLIIDIFVISLYLLCNTGNFKQLIRRPYFKASLPISSDLLETEDSECCNDLEWGIRSLLDTSYIFECKTEVHNSLTLGPGNQAADFFMLARQSDLNFSKDILIYCPVWILDPCESLCLELGRL